MVRERGEDSMRVSLAILSALLLSTASAAVQERTTLDIYVIDVEGGNATLFVTPAGESVLIDTGNLNGAVRDVDRIMDAVHDAGLTQIDHLILTRNMEFKLMCPNTRLPPVQLFLGLHHGVESSNAEVMVHGLRPRVAIINNGTRKGGDPHTMTSVHTSPGLEDLWQIHFSQLSGQEYTQPGMFIANRLDDDSPTMPIAPIATPGPDAPPAPIHNGKAYWIKVSAKPDGSFTVTNQRNGFSKAYGAAPGS